MNKLRIGFYQFRPMFGQKAKNLAHVLEALDPLKADLMVLPELPFTGYYFKDREEMQALAEDPHDSDIVRALTQLCRRRNFYLIAGFAEKAADKYFNSALLIGPEGLIDVYRKLHLFKDEKSIFDPGDQPLRVQTIRDFKIGMMICWDWAFPEIGRILTLQGADVIGHPSNLVLNYCQQVMVGRAIENGVFIVTANRIGSDDRPHGRLTFTGHSQIVDPYGQRLVEAPKNRRYPGIITIDVEAARNKERTKVNDLLKDRRPEFYDEITARNRDA